MNQIFWTDLETEAMTWHFMVNESVFLIISTHISTQVQNCYIYDLETALCRFNDHTLVFPDRNEKQIIFKVTELLFFLFHFL